MTTRTTLRPLAFIVQLVGIVVSGYLMARVPDGRMTPSPAVSRSERFCGNRVMPFTEGR